MKKKLNHNTVWGKRMKGKTNNILLETNASIDVDKEPVSYTHLTLPTSDLV